MNIKYLLYILILLIFSNYSRTGFAQIITPGIAVSEPMAEDIGTVGSIISMSPQGFVESREEYDTNIYGVIADEPLAYMQDTLLPNSKLIVTEGQVYVRVSNVNGEILEGDFLTSSDIAGVAQKATKSGPVVGVAMEDYIVVNDKEEGTILAYVNAGNQFVEQEIQVNLIEALRSGSQAPFLSPVTSLRYILAAIVVAGTFVVGFSSFGKASGSGIEALGRNPMAKNTIQASMIFNFVLTSLIMLMGLTLAYFILVL